MNMKWWHSKTKPKYRLSNWILDIGSGHCPNPECNRVGEQVDCKSVGLLHRVYGELFFTDIVKDYAYKYVWNPFTEQWIEIGTLRKSMPKYTQKQYMYI